MATETGKQAIDTLFLEERRYPPPPEFAAQANAQPEIYDQELEAFWEREGRERVTWFEPFTQVCEWKLPYAQWFLGGKFQHASHLLHRPLQAAASRSCAAFL